MFFLLLPLLSLSLLLKTASSFPQPQDRSPNQNQQLANTDTDTDTETAAAAANLGDSLGTPSRQDLSAWWNQVDVKPGGGGGSDSTGPSTLSFDASSSERPAAAAATADTFLLASTSGALGLLPPPANDPNTLLDNPNTSSPSSDTTLSTDSSNHPSLALSPNGEANSETQTDGSSVSPSPGTLTEGQQQQVALIGDETGVGFPLNILPALGGDAPVIDLPALLEIFNPKIPQPQYPIRYNDKERLEDLKKPDCDDETSPFCCSVGPPDPAGSAKNVHKRRDCRSWGIQWEGCHWRQNMFCCKCADRSTNARIGIGCYNVWYRGNPFYYDKKKVPNPVKPATPSVGQQQQSGGEEGDAAQQLSETGRRKSNLPGTGKAKPDSCLKDQLDHWREIGYI